MKKTCRLIILIFLIYFFIFNSYVFAANITMTENVGSGSKYKWTQTIVYHSNYPNGQDDIVTVTYNISHLVQIYSTGTLKNFKELNFSVPSGYELKNPLWSTQSSGGGTTYNNYYSFDMNNRNKTTHLYAQYEYNFINFRNFSLIYDANGGTNAPESQSASSLENSYNFVVSNTSPKREGYEFLGWSTSKAATYPSYYGGGTINVTGTTVLYAVWEKQTLGGQYTVEWYDSATEKELKKQAIRSGTIGDIVSVTEEDKLITGYIFDKENEKNILSKELTDSGIILKLYFKKKTDVENNSENHPNQDSSGKQDTPSAELENPITGDNMILAIITFILSIISVALVNKKYKKIKRI